MRKGHLIILLITVFFLAFVNSTAVAQITTVNDGTGADVDFTSSTSSFPANWNDDNDEDHYLVVIYANAISGAGLSSTDGIAAGTVTTTFTPGTQSVGTTLYVRIVAHSAAHGNVGTVDSDGVTIDTTAPTAGEVRDGTGIDIGVQSSTTTISANWNAFTDTAIHPTAGATQVIYRWAIGTTPGGAQVQAFTNTGITGSTVTIGSTTGNTGTSATASSLALTVDTTYYVSIRSTNSAGLTTDAQSNGVTIKSTTQTVSSGGGSVTIATATGVFAYVTPINPITDPTDAIAASAGLPVNNFPFGIFAYRIENLTPYANVDVTYTLPSALSDSARWYWYNPKTSAWSNITSSVTKTSSTVWVAHLTDGGVGDAGTAGDGKIDDPIGPGIPGKEGADTSSTIFDNLSTSAGNCGALGFDAIALLGMTYILSRKLRKERSK